MGQCDGGVYLVESVADVANLKVRDPARLAYVTQTTLSVDDAAAVVAALKDRFPAIVGAMRDETQRIWSSLDVQIDWIDSVDAAPRAHPTGLTVLLEETSEPRWTPDRLLLAGLHQPIGACGWGLAHVWVRQIRRHVAAVRRDGHPFPTLPTALADTLLGRALGRVLAHEIGHYLLGTAGHAPHGLMRPHFAPQELLEDTVQPLYGLDSHDREALPSCRSDSRAE